MVEKPHAAAAAAAVLKADRHWDGDRRVLSVMSHTAMLHNQSGPQVTLPGITWLVANRPRQMERSQNPLESSNECIW